MTDRVGEWQATFTGKRFYPLDPRIEDINIIDIAHALSMQTRFIGHCLEFYSIAQHCVLVSQLCSQEFALWGLLHDSAEAFLNDISSPLKHSPEFEFYRKIEASVMEKICLAFGLPSDEPTDVKRVDKKLLATEVRDLMLTGGRGWKYLEEPFDLHIKPWTQEYAKTKFLSRFFELTRQQ